jgi:2',3'-cyclic-nucleotide 2'-phosphodiesterase (5'-nucleotidase family)
LHRSIGRTGIALSALLLASASHGVSSVADAAPGAAAASAPAVGLGAADSLVVLSTTDVIGKTSPCGCHTPKGGLARQQTFADSLRRRYANVLWVDNGNFFPEDELHEGAAWFLISAMKTLRVDAVCVGDHDLRFGLAPLRERARTAHLPLVCANLELRATHAPAFPRTLIKRVGPATVGVFGVMSDVADLGPARDSLVVTDPALAARQAIADLRKQGATVIVMLSQLGKVGAEDLASTLDGVDVAIAGRNPPLLANGRMIRRTLLVYGGEQGQFMGVTRLALDSGGRVKSSRSEMAMLGPEIATEPEMARRVQTYEDAFNERMRQAEKARAASLGMSSAHYQPEHFVGNEVCSRCHQQQAQQWNGTPHARAWRTLVERKKDATPDCVPCHVVGFGRPGGFVTADVTPRMTNVGCENCHGMGTDHDSAIGRNTHRSVAETVCRGCHDATSSPEFDFTQFRPYIDHSHAFGDLPPLKAASPMKSM